MMHQIAPALLPLLENALYSVSERIIFFTDNFGTILFSNSTARARLGFDFEGSNQGFNVATFHLHEELESYAHALETSLELPVQPNFESISLEARIKKETIIKNWSYCCLDGSILPVELMVTPAVDENGNIGGFLFVARDITEHVNRKEALLDSEERYRSVVNVMEEGIIVQDLDGTVTACNTSAELMLGLTMEQMNDPFTGSIPYDTIGIDGQPFPASQYPMAVSLRTGQSCSKVVMGLRKADGNLTWFSINSRPLFRSDAVRPHAVMISLSDITERRRIESELARAHDVAVNAAQLKSAFLANASHEIRTPLNGVLGIVDILMDTDLSERQQSYVKILDQSAGALLALINDLLDLSKIEAGKNILEEEVFDIIDIVRGAVDQLSVQAQNKGIELGLTIFPEIPRQFCGDGKRIRQILSNLLFNALKFTERGEISLRVMPHEETSFFNTICFEITDTGIGISQEACEHIFEPFWQSNQSTQAQYASTGLGLAISKQLVEYMGGRIWAESVVGKGSTFSFTVPLRKVNESSPVPLKSVVVTDLATPQTEETDPAKRDKQYQNMSILLVEDNEVNQQVVLYQLKEWGCKTDIASDGVQALEAVQNQRYDLVLMDCMLPNLDGYEATREIRRREQIEQEQNGGLQQPPLYIVALTANAMQGDREKCLAAGMNDYISKPVRFPILRSAFERWETLRSPQPDSKHDTPTLGKTEQIETLETADFNNDNSLWSGADINQSIIDPNSLTNLRGPANDDKLLLELINIFLNDSTKYLHSIHNSLEQGDLKSAIRHAHALGGSCSHFGAIKLRATCQNIEEFGRNNDLTSARNLVDELDSYFYQTQSELEKIRTFLDSKHLVT